jgi:uncharacterized protein (DUF1697 family)
MSIKIGAKRKMSSFMIQYIALLRGVNVGGKNKIAMPELKVAFEKRDFKNVKTYINSGNILFESDSEEFVVKATCETLIKVDFGLTITVGIITADELHEALSNAPKWWDNDPKSKHNAIFVIPPMTAEEVCKQVGEAKPEYEKVTCYGRMIFWSAPIATFSRTQWSKIAQNKGAYNAITIRNANTTKKLATLCESQGKKKQENNL